ncbi:MAG: (2Fe-2S)-binding protein [Gammaproteobacteria bacterium]|nr:(2Fe-2S)-binding protein [Gammaproteobacteria bacterium]
MVEFELNGVPRRVDMPADTPLLWVIRDGLGLPGTKFGCGMGLCGACTIHLDGQPIRSCALPLSAAAGRRLTTIEGLGAGPAISDLHPAQQAWIEGSVAQCGYCQSGQIMAAAALIDANDDPSDADIDRALSGNLCRCGTYPRIRAAVRRAAELKRGGEAVVQSFDPSVAVAPVGGLPA